MTTVRLLFPLCALLAICISCGSSSNSGQQSILPNTANSTSSVLINESIFYSENANSLTKGDPLTLRCTFNLDVIALSKAKPFSKTSANVVYFLNDAKVADAENGKQVLVETTNLQAGSYQVSANLMLNQVSSAHQMLGNIVILEDLWDNPSGQEWYFETSYVRTKFKDYIWRAISGNGQIFELEINQGNYQDPITKEIELANFIDASGDNLLSIIKSKGSVVGYAGSKNMKKYTDLMNDVDDKNFHKSYYFPGYFYILAPGITTASVIKFDELSHQYTHHTLSTQDDTFGINVSTEAGLINNWLQGSLDGHSSDLEEDMKQLNIHKAKWESYIGPYDISYSGANIKYFGTASWSIIRPSASRNQLIRLGDLYRPSVDALFAKLEGSLKDWGPHYEVSYSEEYGYPTSISYDTGIDDYFYYGFRNIEVINLESFSTNVKL